MKWKLGIMENKKETTIMENQMEKKMENEMETGIILGLYSGYMGIMENKMETTIVYWGNIGIMEKKMETTIVIKECCHPCYANCDDTVSPLKASASTYKPMQQALPRACCWQEQASRSCQPYMYIA